MSSGSSAALAHGARARVTVPVATAGPVVPVVPFVSASVPVVSAIPATPAVPVFTPADVIAALRVATCAAHALVFDRDLAMAGITLADGLLAAFRRYADACEMDRTDTPNHVAPTEKRRRLAPTVIATASAPAAASVATTVPAAAIAADTDAAAIVVHLTDAANGISGMIADLSLAKKVNQDDQYAATISGIAHAVLNLSNAFNLVKDRDVQQHNLDRLVTPIDCEMFMSNVGDFAIGHASMDTKAPIRFRNKDGHIRFRCPYDDPVTFICLLSGKMFTPGAREQHVLLKHMGGKRHMAAVEKLESASACQLCSEDDDEDDGEDDGVLESEDSD